VRAAHGFAAIELTVGVAVLLLPVALLVLALPQWSARQGIARVAARDAARVIGLRGWCDADAATAAVRRVGADAGLTDGALRLTLDCPGGAALARDGAVTARVTVAMPVLAVPFVGSGPARQWTAGHREPIDPYGSRP
jgi:hypothetical protein